MIVVVEGISAAGKTTWLRRHAPNGFVGEGAARPDAPPRPGDPAALAAFWVARNVERWTQALALERAQGLAWCDTDPLKIHYDWTLWRAGLQDRAGFEESLTATRAAVAARTLGFADAWRVRTITPERARRQRDADHTRTRRRFEVHLALQPALIEWYRAIEHVLPGRVHWSFPQSAALDAGPANQRRFDVGLLDELCAALPGGG